ncbi:putative short-chain dehydrogenase reductase family protein-1 [Coleophoma cylindrospora]|uniref:Putative short-chain dehydrogenase reductase family protein-1 n=1 Tax=Coleophoma cylindrospora TaxID=1849047 RepID=A0A3D8RV04_9HELO|nr:putative short-chain dehydrogenase reductase family protein-1 [Coleophoma cylindrospora]
MPNIEEFVNFDAERDIPSLENKVIFVTGGTAGLGRASVIALAKHNPAYIYFTGRNADAGKSLIVEVQKVNPSIGAKFVKMDMMSLASVKEACATDFSHDRLDVLMCNAGVMFIPPGLSKDGFENHFAINHLAHAMIIQQLLPVMTKTAAMPNSDVRILSLTSTAWMAHPSNGVTFSTLRTTQEGFMGSSFRYGQSKLANIVYAAELARQYQDSKIKFVSVHPGACATDLATTISFGHRILMKLIFWWTGVSMMEVHQGRLSQLWAAAGAKKDELVNGGFYMPIGRLSDDRLDKTAKSRELAEELWTYTQDALAKF